jgi:hypothetical protein
VGDAVNNKMCGTSSTRYNNLYNVLPVALVFLISDMFYEIFQSIFLTSPQKKGAILQVQVLQVVVTMKTYSKLRVHILSAFHSTIQKFQVRRADLNGETILL